MYLLSSSIYLLFYSFMVLTTIAHSFSTFWAVTLSYVSIFGSGSYSQSLESLMITTGTSYTCVCTTATPVIIFTLLEYDDALCASISSSYTTSGPGIISPLYVSTTGGSATNSGCVLQSSSTNPEYSSSYSFYQSKGSLFMLSNSSYFPCCSFFIFKSVIHFYYGSVWYNYRDYLPPLYYSNYV